MNRKKIAIVSLVLLCLSLGMNGQLATLDSKKIMSTLPVFSKIDTLVQEESQKYAGEYRAKLELAQKLTDSLRIIGNLKALEKSSLTARAEKATLDFKQYEQQVNKKIEDYKFLILNPYYDRINKAIKAVAQRLKLKQVIDIQSVALAYLDPTSDITEEVIKEMKN